MIEGLVNLQKNSQNNFFKIGNKIVSNSKVFIVAEISANHNNSYLRAKNLIIKAKKCGADAVKLQTFTPDTITLDSNNKDFRLNHLKSNKDWKKYKNFYQMYKYASMPWEWQKKLFKLAKKIKIEIFSSPFDETAVDFLESINCSAYKIASAEINHIPLIEKIAKLKKPVIFSTGLAKENEIKTIINIFKKNKNNKIIILKCNSSYPAKIQESDLRNIEYLKKRFKLPVGLSDHTIGNTAAISAVSLGACMIEKHFNLDDKKKTIDSFFSSSEKEFKQMVKNIRDTEEALGVYKYQMSKSSYINLKSKRSIYVCKNIKKGDKFSNLNIKVVRPSMGLHPKYYKKIIGKKVNKNLFAGQRVKLEYIK